MRKNILDARCKIIFILLSEYPNTVIHRVAIGFSRNSFEREVRLIATNSPCGASAFYERQHASFFVRVVRSVFVVENKKPPPNMETENKYTIHSHIHQYAPHITARPRRSLLTDIRHVFTSATREWFSRPRFEKSKPTGPRFSPSCAYSVSGSHLPRLSVTFLRSYCLRHSL